MTNTFVNTDGLPFCKGCGHHLVSRYTEDALKKAGYSNPLDVILVTDIGCVGIIDKQFYSHTVHGLHGRSIALGAGVAMGLENPKKKVIVFLGDGGATIGLQHLLEAAQKNINMTVVVHNNMLYGMTGGQPSGLTPNNFKTAINFEKAPKTGYDLCRIVDTLKAPLARRVLADANLVDVLADAYLVKGFSLVEVVEICPSYGVKRNLGKKIQDILAEAGIELTEFRHPEREVYGLGDQNPRPSLLEELSVIQETFKAEASGRKTIILAGSAGEGVQTAAEFFAMAAISSKLHATKKGSYPVTVGIGFSTAEMVISSQQIKYTGIEVPDFVIVVSADGLEHKRGVIEKMQGGTLLIDSSLQVPKTGARIVQKDLRTPFSGRNAALFSLFSAVKDSGLIPLEALSESVKQSSLGSKLDIEKMISQA